MPIGNRVGVYDYWSSNWDNKYNYSNQLHKDYIVKKTIKLFFDKSIKNIFALKKNNTIHIGKIDVKYANKLYTIYKNEYKNNPSVNKHFKKSLKVCKSYYEVTNYNKIIKTIKRQKAYIGRIWLLRLFNTTVVVASYFKPVTKINKTNKKTIQKPSKSSLFIRQLLILNRSKKNIKKNMF